MPTITCPNCNQLYEVEDTVLGEKVECAVCNTTFVAQEKEHIQSSAADSVRESMQETTYKGKFYSKEEIIKLAIYQNLFVFEFVIYTLLLVLLFLFIKSDNTFILYNLVFTSLILLFPSLLVLYISLRHSLKESIFGTLIAIILFFIPICRFACCIASIVQSTKVISSASLNGKDLFPSIPLLKVLINESEHKTPKRIMRLTKIYAIFSLLLMIPIMGYNISAYYVEKGENRQQQKVVTARNSHQNYAGRVSKTNSNSEASFFERNKDVLIPAAIIFGAALLTPDTHQTKNNPSSSLPFSGRTGTSTFGRTTSSSGAGSFGSTGSSMFGGTTGAGSSIGTFPNSGSAQHPTFSESTTTTFSDSHGMPAGSARTSTLGGITTIDFRDSHGMPAGSAL